MTAAVDAAAGLAELPPVGIREIKSLLQHGPGLDLRTRYEREIAAARAQSHPDQIDGLVAGFADRNSRRRR